MASYHSYSSVTPITNYAFSVLRFAAVMHHETFGILPEHFVYQSKILECPGDGFPKVSQLPCDAIAKAQNMMLHLRLSNAMGISRTFTTRNICATVNLVLAVMILSSLPIRWIIVFHSSDNFSAIGNSLFQQSYLPTIITFSAIFGKHFSTFHKPYNLP